MKMLLTDSAIKKLKPPETGELIIRDTKLKGFGVRILPSGTASFVIDYMSSGRRRIHTIGKLGPEWDSIRARAMAADLKRKIRYEGLDPAEDIKTAREAETVKDLCERFISECFPQLREGTAVGYESKIRIHILPALGALKAKAVTYSHIQKLHQELSAKHRPLANGVVIVLNRIYNIALAKWQVVDRNPCKGIELNQKVSRQRYLTTDELKRLSHVLDGHADQQAANIIRLLLLTGARTQEVVGMTWGELDLESGIWTKPSSRTKTKIMHRLPLNDNARELLLELKAEASSIFVFPGHHGKTGHRVKLGKRWPEICKAANIVGLRIHDLRHSHASFLASGGYSLPIIGALLGHTAVASTMKYSHLTDASTREATQFVGNVIPIRKKRA